ncbi:MAG: hypothetical protein HY243_14430 [Proteobacteria bacterium]|nr:hypothetical protein [Pseudomonadota bacterium]
MTTLVYILHIGGGMLGLVSGTIAAIAAKGGRLHRTAGTVFFVSMLVMATFAAWLAVVVPDQIVNVFIATFTVYLVATAWLTVRRKEGTIGFAERIALVVALILWAPFAILAFQLATGLPPLFKSAVPFKGPVLIALYGFTTVLAIAALADAKVVFSGGISGAPRIARHLWRMCLGLTLAAGSAFTNGFARFLPGPYHVPTIFFLPQFLPLGLLIFWMIRVRFTDWVKRNVIALQTV